MENTHIYCDVCRSVQPMVIGSPQGDDKTGRFTNARDIECGTCGLVIATTYSPRFTSADALRRVMGRR